MPLPSKTKKYLDKKIAKYEPIAHKTVYTAYDLAQTLRTELKQIAKTLLIATDKAYVLAVVPAHMRVDLKKLQKAVGAKKLSIPKEQVMVKIFKVKPGAMSAFGGLHKLEIWADKSLVKTKDVILSAGNFTDSVRMNVKDYLKMEQAKLASFAKSSGLKLTAKPAKKAKKAKKKTGKKKFAKPAKRKPVKKVAKKKPTKKVVKKGSKKRR
jgi:prolyl-tRNA editing enzyme YbaK/EbsC (Cys-tRNA(Pro) deacylase)